MVFALGGVIIGIILLVSGGAFLVLCDALSRSLITETTIPVGVITALFGAPFFLWLLLSGVFSERG